MDTVKLLAHRGASDLYPENTLLSFRKAVELGADGIELDVQLTKDQQLVVIHDFVINRMYQGEGEVNQFDLLNLKEIPLSEEIKKRPTYEESWKIERIPTLEEVLKILPQDGRFILNIELKTNDNQYEKLVEKLIPLLKKYSNIHYVISSFCAPALKEMKQVGEYETAWLVEKQDLEISNEFDSSYMDSLHASKTLLFTGKLDTFFHRYPEVPVRIWTVNDKDEKQKCLSYPISAIFSDIVQ